MPELELDERFFEILSQSPKAAIVRNKVSGKLSVWHLTWKPLDTSVDEARAWAQFMKEAM